MARIYLGEGDSVLRAENNLVDIRLAGGELLSNLEPRRLFPVSSAWSYVSFLDESGEEIAILRDMSELPHESQAVLKASLDEYYFVPTINRIISKSDKYGTLRFTVETDRGVVSFDIKNRNQDIRLSDDGRVRIRDSHDNRYVISDYRQLDAYSKALIVIDL